VQVVGADEAYRRMRLGDGHHLLQALREQDVVGLEDLAVLALADHQPQRHVVIADDPVGALVAVGPDP
jgi:hypothetical protein